MKFTIKARLFLGFSILGLLFVGLGVFSINSLSTNNKTTTTITGSVLPSVDYAHSMDTATADYRVIELDYTLSDASTDMSSFEKEMTSLNKDIQKNIVAYRSLVNSNDDKQLIDSFETEWNKYIEISAKIITVDKSGNKQEAIAIINNESKEIFDSLADTTLELVQYNKDEANKLSSNASTIYANTRTILLVVIIIVIIICLVLSIIITSSIVKPINKLVKVADILASGDVDVNVVTKSNDEIGDLTRSFGRMIETISQQAIAAERIADGDLTVEVEVRSEKDLLNKKLHQMVENNNEILSSIASASEQVAVGAKQVSDASISLSEGATEQASSIEELTASIEEISSQTELNAQNATQANTLAEAAKINASESNDQMKAMLTAMEDINESSSSIYKIIKVIDDIAFQTNILALNAAVEAARAGQHGKGFAVVAEEVRTLAARSASAAKETADMIEGSLKKAEGGTVIAKETAESLNNIVIEIEKVANLVGDIAVASNEQASGISQINQGIIQVSQVIQANSATSEESAAASEELSSQAILLKETVSKFKLKQSTEKYNQYESLSPDVLRMLENMADKNKKNVSQAENTAKESFGSKPKITLSDSEFGKY